MRSLSLTYLIQRFSYRITEFLRHWYIKSATIYWHGFFNLLERLDYYLAWKITLKYLFKPLYKDRTIIGYIMGFFWRSVRLLAGGVVYILLFLAALAVYLIWLLTPVLIVYKIIQ